MAAPEVRVPPVLADELPPVPLAPTDLAATPSDGGIELTWTDNASNEVSFDIERRERVGGVWGSWTSLASVGADVTNHTDASVAVGNGYRYRVRACNTAGCSDDVRSAFVDAVAFIPLEPTDLVATPSDGGIELTWTDNASNEVSFDIERRERVGGVWGSWTSLASVGADVTNHTDASVTVGNGYRYRVRACNTAGCSDDAKSAFVDAVAFFDIELVFEDSPTASEEAAFEAARARWEAIISSDIPDISANLTPVRGCHGRLTGTFDDVIIFVNLSSIDGPGGVLGSAGPCYFRTPSGLPITGVMTFDTDDLAELSADGLLEDVILHEMGHVLGVGTLWDYEGLLVGAGGADPYFLGANALIGFDNVGGSGYVGNKVPVENTGGAGTQDSHWRESVFDNELMTGFIADGTNPLSEVTVSSLIDHGYDVDLAEADFYSLPLAGAPALRDRRHIRLLDDVRRGPIYAVSPAGDITPFRPGNGR